MEFSRKLYKRTALLTIAMSSLTLTACSSTSTTNNTHTSTSTPTQTVSANKNTTILGGVKSDKALGTPTNITIDSIKLNKPVKSMGLAADGTLAPPAQTVEWYNKTVVPGDVGNSVIAGHVTYNGPDVFVNLDKMKNGDIVSIKYSSGKVKKFKTTRTKSVSKEELRTDQTVWGDNSKPALVLITCDAESKLIGRHHVNNFVVWTTPIN